MFSHKFLKYISSAQYRKLDAQEMFAASVQAVIENICGRGIKGGGRDSARHTPSEWSGRRSTFQASSFSELPSASWSNTPHPRRNAVRLHVNPKFNAH